MTRVRRSTEELLEASNHLYYEFWMFMNLSNVMSRGIFGQGIINNAVLESFTIHTRTLLEFLYSENPHKEDVIAEDFFKDHTTWVGKRPEKASTLSDIRWRVGKEAAHLSYLRSEIAPEAKKWPFAEIAREIKESFAQFLKLVPHDLLGHEWDDYKKQGVV